MQTMTEKQSTIPITVRVPAEMKERLERLAEATSRSKSWLATDALGRYLDLEEWQIAETQAGLREADAGDFASDAEVQAVFSRWRED